MTGADDLFWVRPGDFPYPLAQRRSRQDHGLFRRRLVVEPRHDRIDPPGGRRHQSGRAGTPSATFVQVHVRQVDIGWSGPPFGIDALQAGKIHIIAVYSDVPAFRNMTVRMHVTCNFLTNRRELADRFLRADAETLDWMYAGDEAIAEFAAMTGIPQDQARITRDKFYPRGNLTLARLSGLDDAMKDAIAARFLSEPLRRDQLDELFRFYLR